MLVISSDRKLIIRMEINMKGKDLPPGVEQYANCCIFQACRQFIFGKFAFFQSATPNMTLKIISHYYDNGIFTICGFKLERRS